MAEIARNPELKRRIVTVAEHYMAEGRAEGIVEGLARAAQGMFKQGMEVPTIAKSLGITPEEAQYYITMQ